MKIYYLLLAALCTILCAAASAQSHALLFPLIGPQESLPLRVMSAGISGGARSFSQGPSSRPPNSTPCFSGGTAGNFTIVLNCDGNDNDGSSAYENVPDTDLAVSEQYVMQTVDNVFTIYNKSDLSVVEGPDPLTMPWTGFGDGSCSTAGSGDDFDIRYDKAAGQWILALPIFGDAEGRYWLCLAVSTTSDPTGTYYLYAVQETGSQHPIWDYPKLGVWTDAYYVGFNMISPKPVYLGPRACALDRTSMLSGAQAAAMQCFSRPASSDSFMLPADIAGGTQPAPGEPDFFLDIAPSSTGPHSALNLWSFHVDFADSQDSTFSGPTALAVTGFSEGPQEVPEPHGSLNSRSDRLMVPLAWRQTADGIEHLVVNDAIAGDDAMTEQWFDITSPSTAPVVAQRGSLTPDPHDNFWMGSANMDQAGNIALGFSNAGSKIAPGAMFTGRLATDPVDTMEAVQTVIAGSGYEGGSEEWGDHSIMAVDPSDDCTFWYSNEYFTLANSDTAEWSTRIIAFKFTSCP